MRAGRSLVPDLPLNQKEGARGVAAFNKLRLPDVVGTPTLADASGDWFRDIVRALFGSVDQATGQRMIREIFCLIAKKQSKTSYGALVMVVALLLNLRPRAPFMFTAPVQDTADLAFSQAAGAIALDPVLEKKLYVRDHLKTIIHRETKAELEIVTFDPAVVTGKKPIGIMIDELHVISKMAKAASALRQLRGGQLPFPEAFMLTMTTQSEEAPTGVFKTELQKARDVRDGKFRAPILPVLYEFPQEIQKSEAWRDPANWPMVSPNLGRSVTLDRLQQGYREAEHAGEAELRAWASQHLNIEIGLALMSDGWAGADYWERQTIPAFTLADLIARCEVIDVGLDGGGLDDLLGMAAVGREKDTGIWLVWAHAWAHPAVLERRKQIAGTLRDFAAAGDLTLVDKIGDDVEEVAGLVASIETAGLLDKIGVDPHGLGGILDALEAAKVPKEKVIGISQGWKMVGSIKTTERRLAEGTMQHGGQPLMAWCCGNAKVEPRGNAIAITKQAAGSAKIDPLMAMFNAVSLLSLNPASPQKKYQMLVLGYGFTDRLAAK